MVYAYRYLLETVISVILLICVRAANESSFDLYRHVKLENSTVLVPRFWSHSHADATLNPSTKLLWEQSRKVKITVDSSLSYEEARLLALLRRRWVLDRALIATMSVSTCINRTITRNAAVNRPKRHAQVVDSIQDQLCAPIANAIPVGSETLSCDMQIDKLTSAKTLKLLKISQTQLLQEVELCHCSARNVERCCGFYFWGTKRTWEIVTQTDSNATLCQEACRNVSGEFTGVYLHKTGNTDYSCWWARDHCNQGVIYSATRTKGSLHVPSQSLFGSYLTGGYCDLKKGDVCEGYSGSKIIPLAGWFKRLSPPEFSEIEMDMVTDPEKGLMLVYEPSQGGNVINLTCHHSFLGQEKIYSGLNGEYFILPPNYQPTQSPRCLQVSPQLNNPALKFGKIIETRSELVAQYRYCILTKMAVETALKVGTPIHNELLKGLTVRGNRNLAFFTYNHQLMALECQPVEYDSIVKVGRNCYKCTDRGYTVGYLDAPLGLMFRGRCISNDTTLSPTIGNNWIVTVEDGVERVKRSTTSLSRYIQAMEAMSNSSTQLLKRVYGDPYAGVTEDANFEFDKELRLDRLSQNPYVAPASEWWNSISLLSKLGSLGGGAVVVLGIIIIIIICCRR